MPQLDQFTYLTQFVWLCVFYMIFYVLLFNDGLPKISRILKLRAHLCADRSQGSDPEHETVPSDNTVSKVPSNGGASSQRCCLPNIKQQYILFEFKCSRSF